MEQKKYHSIVRLGHKSTIGIFKEGDHIVIQEKLDGCFHYNTPVLLADGTTEKIGRIVDKKMDLEVMSYDLKNGTYEAKKIKRWYNHGKKKEFIALKVSSTKRSRANRIICTRDHLFYTDKGYVKAEELTEYHKLYTLSDKLSEIQKQLILGSLLGDSSAYPNRKNETRNRGIAFSHSDKQIEYKNLKDKILDKYFSKTESYISGFGANGHRSFSKCTISTNEVIKTCYNNNRKTVTRSWLDELSPIGLAFWYMDDGSLSHNNKQNDRATLHTQGFSEEEVDIIIHYLHQKWGIKSSKTYNKSGFMISMNTEGSDKFFTLVSPYIHNTMMYKLPTYYRNDYSYWDYFKERNNINGLVEVKFLGFEDLPSYLSNFNNYDIEVEDNHNYFVNGVLVHNSNASFRKDGNTVRAYSRNQELNEENNLGGFYQWVQDNIIPDSLYDDAIYFGEWINPHKIKYPQYQKQFFLYDVYHEHYRTFTTVKYEAERLSLNLIPVFYCGEYKSFEHLQSFVGRTDIGGQFQGKEMGEGIVVKNPHYRDRYGKQIFVKLVSDEFAEVQKQKPPKDPSKVSIEQIFVNTTVTEARVDKLLHKFVDEGILDEHYGIEDMGVILKNMGDRIFYDIMSEEFNMLPTNYEEKNIRRAIGKTIPQIVKKIITKA